MTQNDEKKEIVEGAVDTQQPEQTSPREDTALATPEPASEKKYAKEQKYYCGSQLKEMKDCLVISRPIERGSVKNWEELEALW